MTIILSMLAGIVVGTSLVSWLLMDSPLWVWKTLWYVILLKLFWRP